MSAVPRTGSSAKWGPMREPSVSRGQSPDLHFGSAWEGLGEPGVSRGRSRQSTFRQREGSVGWAERVTGTEPPSYIFCGARAAGHCPTLGPKVGFAAPPYEIRAALRDPGGLTGSGRPYGIRTTL
jgi:hypothetical protein